MNDSPAKARVDVTRDRCSQSENNMYNVDSLQCGYARSRPVRA